MLPQMATLSLLMSTLALVSASPTALTARTITPNFPISTNGICGAFNGTATCIESGFGLCCSQFGYCGDGSAYCGAGCQTDYGVCGVPATLNWNNLGCYTDDTNARTLNTSVLVPGHTVESCQTECAELGFLMAGLEYGTQCFCGNAIMNGATPGSTGCTTPCAQNASEICGGSDAISVYSVIPVWQSLGCWSDNTLKRTLGSSYNVAGNSVEKCTAACQAGGYIYAGMEFGTQCFCGNVLNNGGALTSGCGTACPGDATEVCGGSNALSLYYLFE